MQPRTSKIKWTEKLVGHYRGTADIKACKDCEIEDHSEYNGLVDTYSREMHVKGPLDEFVTVTAVDGDWEFETWTAEGDQTNARSITVAVGADASVSFRDPEAPGGPCLQWVDGSWVDVCVGYSGTASGGGVLELGASVGDTIVGGLSIPADDIMATARPFLGWECDYVESDYPICVTQAPVQAASPSIHAVFKPDDLHPIALGVRVAGGGGSCPGWIEGVEAKRLYSPGETVQLTAHANPGFAFSHWEIEDTASADPDAEPTVNPSATITGTPSEQTFTAVFEYDGLELEVLYMNFIPVNNIEAPLPCASVLPPTVQKQYAAGDDRGFDPNSDKFRMRSEVHGVWPTCQDIVELGTVNAMGISTHYAADAIGEDGNILPHAYFDTVLGDCHFKHCEAQASNSGMSASLSGGKTEATITISGSGTNPCAWPTACSIDYDLTLELTRNSELSSISWNLSGDHDKFPAHELYLVLNGVTTPIHQFMPSGSVAGLCYPGFLGEHVELSGEIPY